MIEVKKKNLLERDYFSQTFQNVCAVFIIKMFSKNLFADTNDSFTGLGLLMT